jgi:Site-specific recombinase XerD
MKDTYQWRSSLAPMMRQFLNEKKMTGYKFGEQEKYIKRFDLFYEMKGYSGIRLTKQMTDTFIYNLEERPSTWYIKERILRDLAMFLHRNGYSEIYIPEVKSAPKKTTHYPYIFTEVEMGRLFSVIDQWEDSHYTDRHLTDPVFFRLLYSTGMRLSEALYLTVGDLDTANGLLTVYHAKNNKDRLIPLAQSMQQRIADYVGRMHCYSKPSDYMFPSMHGYEYAIDQSTMHRRFRQYLFRAGISLTGSGPRIHDLRHNYAVKCLKKWVLQGIELSVMLPYLAAYMGHSDFRGTQYYLRLTADLYPDIISRTEAGFGYVIPEGGADNERE